MAKTWVLDTDTKGTGARMVPLEDVLKNPEPKGSPPRRTRTSSPKPPPPRRPQPHVEKRSTALPAGHVRKKSTGELGRVKAIDAKAGMITVTWLHGGRTSTVPISSVTRR